MNTELLTHQPVLGGIDGTNNKIVFYIRALFIDNIPTEFMYGPVKMATYVEYFNNYSKISMRDYRHYVHKIQKECLTKISNRFIYNLTEDGFPYPYGTIQPAAHQSIMALADDDIVIPLDDDDWLSPEIKNLKFCSDGITIWSAFMDDVFLPNVYFYPHNRALPENISLEEDVSHAHKLLSNCMAVPAKYLKKMGAGDFLHFNGFMQRHILPRLIIRNECKNLNMGERIYSNHFGIYVRHAANMTALDKQDISIFDTDEFFNSKIKKYNSLKYSNSDTLPEEHAWCKPYYKKLEELNCML